MSGQDAASSSVKTLDDERTFNSFLRLTSASLIATLRRRFPDLSPSPNAKTVFIKLREWHNTW